MDTKSTKKISFTFVDMIIIFILAVLLYFAYYNAKDAQNAEVKQESIYTEFVCESIFPHGDYVGKLAKYDAVFDESGNENIGDIEEVKYENISSGGVKVTLTVSAVGTINDGDRFFVNTDAFCGNFTVVSVIGQKMQIIEGEVS